MTFDTTTPASTNTTSWDKVRIGDLGVVQTGSTPPTSNRALYGNSYMFVSPADMGQHKYIRQTQKMLSPSGFKQSRHFSRGSVLFVCVGSTIGKIGLAAEALTSNQQINAVTPGKNVDSEFLYYTLSTVSELVRSQAGEQAVPLVNKSDFSAFSVLLPNITEQRLIAASLSDADSMVETLERLIAKKQAIKQGMMQQLLTGKTRLPGLTETWNNLRLGDVARCIRGVTYNPSADLADGDSPSTARLLRSNNVQARRVQLRDMQFVSKRKVGTDQFIRKNDILVCMANGSKDLVGKSAILRIDDPVHRYTFGAFMGVVRTNEDSADPRFVGYALQSEGFRKVLDVAMAGSSINNLRPRDIESFNMEAPALEEQRAISNVLEEMDIELDRLQKRLDKTRKIKQGMMQELLTGRTRLQPAEITA